jgi:hypothetical protein
MSVIRGLHGEDFSDITQAFCNPGNQECFQLPAKNNYSLINFPEVILLLRFILIK